jgi:hypothetical protein
MKQLLPLFLFLLPCLALAQYPSNGNQKITLGEQTTADGLIFRGVAADTTLTAKSDTAAYFVLDTVNKKLYFYKESATPKWNEISGSGGGGTVTSVAALTLGTTGTDLSSTVANSTTTPVITLNVPNASVAARGLVSKDTQTFTGIKTFDKFIKTSQALQSNSISVLTDVGSGTSQQTYAVLGFGAYWGIKYYNIPAGAHSFGIDVYNSNSPKNALTILNNGEILMGYTTDQGTSILSVNGDVSANGSVLTSDQRFKENITPLNKGLEIINKLKPVTFNFINNTNNNFSEFEEVGFIAQDVDKALSTETFVKSIVKYTDESNIDSKMVISPHNLIPILTKAIQEQQALIKALEQRIINLENK